MTAPARAARRDEPPLRETLSSLQGLLALAMLMGEDRGEDEVVHLAVTAVPSLGRCRIEGILHSGLGWRATTGACTRPGSRARIQAQLAGAAPGGAPLVVPDRAWAWAFALRGRAEQLGHVVVTADRLPSDAELHLVRALVAQAGTALANARSRGRERADAAQLRATNAVLVDTVAALRRRTAVHDRLNEVAVAGEGRAGIARALHELTGLAASVEDGRGNVLARAGPPAPPAATVAPAAPASAARGRARSLRRALATGRPVRADGRVLVAACRDDQVLGVLVLADPDGRAGEQDVAALEHAATVLTVELARLQGIADGELRLGRDVVSDLVNGIEVESAVERARSVGHDLRRPHRVLVLDGPGDPAALVAAVRQAVRDHRSSPLVLPQEGGGVVAVVAVAPAGTGDPVAADAPQGPEESGEPGRWERFRAAVLAGSGVRGCRLGVGGVAARPADYPRSHHEAVCALRLHDVVGGPGRAVCYDDMALGRSTVKYRLRRIRQLSGHDLSQPDTRFNLQLATRALAAQRVL